MHPRLMDSTFLKWSPLVGALFNGSIAGMENVVQYKNGKITATQATVDTTVSAAIGATSCGLGAYAGTKIGFYAGAAFGSSIPGPGTVAGPVVGLGVAAVSWGLLDLKDLAWSKIW